MQFSTPSGTDRRVGTTADRAPDWRSNRLLTVGHSNHEIDRFLDLLRNAEVTAIADVRSNPYSERQAQFNQTELCRALDRAGLKYVFLGDELGGRPRDPGLYDSQGRVDYWRVRATTVFRSGLDRLYTELKSHNVALMCAEEDPLVCHRTLMVAAALVEQGMSLHHLRRDGSIETTSQLEDRLFEVTGVGGGMVRGLFAASISPEERAELLDEAYRAQAGRKAFRLPPGQTFAAIDRFQEYTTE